jgi:DNA-binding GntR family transcriptional regulator
MIGSVVPTQELSTVPTVPMSYRQIADDVADRIQAGEYRPGDELPSHAKLAELYSVSRATATRAYGLLHDRGLIVGVPGRAVYVAEPRPST